MTCNLGRGNNSVVTTIFEFLNFEADTQQTRLKTLVTVKNTTRAQNSSQWWVKATTAQIAVPYDDSQIINRPS